MEVVVLVIHLAFRDAEDLGCALDDAATGVASDLHWADATVTVSGRDELTAFGLDQRHASDELGRVSGQALRVLEVVPVLGQAVIGTFGPGGVAHELIVLLEHVLRFVGFDTTNERASLWGFRAVLVALLRAILDVAGGDQRILGDRVFDRTVEDGEAQYGDTSAEDSPGSSEEPDLGAATQRADGRGADQSTNETHEAPAPAHERGPHDGCPLAQEAPDGTDDDGGVLDDGCPQAAANADERVLVHDHSRL